MEISHELKKIKKMYGENFMHLCRNLFPTLLETEGRLFEILTKSFSNNSRTLYNDIINNGLEEKFKNYIYNPIDIEVLENNIEEKRTPYELLDEVGYELYECTSEREIQSFKKYYAPNEELCTFNGGRLNRCVVFWAVRKDVDKIKREDYKIPKREDEYGTSVMGIQFNKEGRCTVSIKNRYNHRVKNPDATYGNDLDRIIPGLTQSFADLLAERGLMLDSNNKEIFHIPGYVVASDGKYYKYNYEINGIYYCPGNIIIENGEARQLKEHEMLIDYFVLNTKEKTLKLYDESQEDSFTDTFDGKINKIEIVREKENGVRTIRIFMASNKYPIIMDINADNEIVKYENMELRQVGCSFLKHSRALKVLKLPMLRRCDSGFLLHNESLTELSLPNLQEIGFNFLTCNNSLRELSLPKLKQGKYAFLANNASLININLPRLEQVEDSFLICNKNIITFNLPRLKNKEVINRLKLKAKENSKKITSRDLAILDKDTELTTSEVGWIARLFSKIKNISKNLMER